MVHLQAHCHPTTTILDGVERTGITPFLVNLVPFSCSSSATVPASCGGDLGGLASVWVSVTHTITYLWELWPLVWLTDKFTIAWVVKTGKWVIILRGRLRAEFGNSGPWCQLTLLTGWVNGKLGGQFRRVDHCISLEPVGKPWWTSTVTDTADFLLAVGWSVQLSSVSGTNLVGKVFLSIVTFDRLGGPDK